MVMIDEKMGELSDVTADLQIEAKEEQFSEEIVDLSGEDLDATGNLMFTRTKRTIKARHTFAIRYRAGSAQQVINGGWFVENAFNDLTSSTRTRITSNGPVNRKEWIVVVRNNGSQSVPGYFYLFTVPQ